MNRGEMPDRMEKLQVSFTGDKPMEMVHAAEQDAAGPADAQRATVHQLGITIKAYLDAVKGLLQGKYANVRDWAPAHLADPGNVMVIVCPDGVLVRFERRMQDKKKVGVGWASESLSELVRRLSQGLIHCHTDRNFSFNTTENGHRAETATEGESPPRTPQEDIGVMRIRFDAVIERPERFPAPPQKPFCLLSVRNEVELQTLGVLRNASAEPDKGQRFVTRSLVRLPLGWECIEVYPFFDPLQWQPEYAATWAENDLLAAVLGRQLREAQLQTLDPNTAASAGIARF